MHAYTRRKGPPGVDLWECQDCDDEGPLKELMSRECKAPAPVNPAAAFERNLLHALDPSNDEHPPAHALIVKP